MYLLKGSDIHPTVHWNTSSVLRPGVHWLYWFFQHQIYLVLFLPWASSIQSCWRIQHKHDHIFRTASGFSGVVVLATCPGPHTAGKYCVCHFPCDAIHVASTRRQWQPEGVNSAETRTWSLTSFPSINTTDSVGWDWAPSSNNSLKCSMWMIDMIIDIIHILLESSSTYSFCLTSINPIRNHQTEFGQLLSAHPGLQCEQKLLAFNADLHCQIH